MSSHGFAAPLTVEPGASAVLGMGLALAHGGAAIVLLLLPLPQWLHWLGVTLLAGALLASLACHVLHLGPRAVRAVTWHGDGSWSLVDGIGRIRDCELVLPAYVHPWLMVLTFKVPGHRLSRVLVIAPDGPADGRRRLRVRLRQLSCVPEGSAP
jgi:toxin CptA